MPSLLASAPTLSKLEVLFDRFYYGQGYTVDRETLTIKRPDGESSPLGVQVRKIGGRFRFEMI